jgi:hypothetical protein
MRNRRHHLYLHTPLLILGNADSFHQAKHPRSPTALAYTRMGDDVTGAVQDDLAKLGQWYEEYLVANLIGPMPYHVIRALDNDIVDHEQIEQQISLQASRLPDFEYFCDECRDTFDHWPEVDGKLCICRSNTIALEAAARRGCRFCCFLLQILIDKKSLLTFRRIEKRLKILGECEPFTVDLHWSEGEDKSYGMSSINPPGRPNRLNQPMMCCITLTYLEPHGEQPPEHIMISAWTSNVCQPIHINRQLTFPKPLPLGYENVIKATKLVACPWPTRYPPGSSGSRVRE